MDRNPNVTTMFASAFLHHLDQQTKNNVLSSSPDMTRPVDESTDEESDFAFGNVCLLCGNETTGVYCSTECEAQDGAEETPALLSHDDSWSTSGGSTPPSSTPVSPFFGAIKTDAPSATQLKGALHFDYGYQVPDKDEDDLYSRLASSEATVMFNDHLEHARRRSSLSNPPSAAASPRTTADIPKLRRSQHQMPKDPRRLSSNLLSPVLKPLTAVSPVVRPIHSTCKATSSEHHKACGRPQCPSLLGRAAPTSPTPLSTSMARRASAPLVQRTQRRSSDLDEADAAEEPIQRGRSRAPRSTRLPSMDRAHPVRQRAESAHLLDASAAPICTKPDDCMATIKGKTGKPAPHPNQGIRYLFGRASQSQELTTPRSIDLDSQVSALSLDQAYSLDSAVMYSSSSGSEGGIMRGREQHKQVKLVAAEAASTEIERGRSRVRQGNTSAEALRSKSPHREGRSRSTARRRLGLVDR